MDMNFTLATAALAVGLWANASPVASGPSPVSFDLKETASSYTLGSGALVSGIPIAYVKGETVSVTHSGATTTPVSAAAAPGVYSWSPDSGGLWTLVNSDEGTVEFRLHYSLFQLDGAGTEANPAKVLDGTDFAERFALLDAGARDGFTFLIDSDSPSIDDFARPSGYAILEGFGGVYRLVEAADGRISGSVWGTFGIDTRKSGPNRSISAADEVLPMAYSGDGWLRDASAESTMTIFAPDGSESFSTNCVGTGAFGHVLAGKGCWTVVLEFGETQLVSVINYNNGFFLIVR